MFSSSTSKISTLPEISPKTHLYKICLSVIPIAEIRAGINGNEEDQALDQFLSAIPLYEVTGTIAEMGGDWVRQFDRSHSVEGPDALIAATAAAITSS